MVKGVLPDNIMVAFTGDEEENCTGANHLIKYLNSQKLHIKTIIVLDVTDMGWNEKGDFTIENNFWNESIGKKVITVAQKMQYIWRFVPENVDIIPCYIPSDKVIYEEAEEDESWFYDEKEQSCFSFCLPVNGEMHSNRGVLALKKAFENYTDSLAVLLNEL